MIEKIIGGVFLYVFLTTFIFPLLIFVGLFYLLKRSIDKSKSNAAANQFTHNSTQKDFDAIDHLFNSKNKND